MNSAPTMNLLVLLCDQLQRDVTGPWAGPVLTPHWSRLAGESAVFDRFYCATPLCIPTRPSMMTGRWPHAHGSTSFGEGYATMNPGEELLIDRLHDAGYRVGYQGIWHINRAEGEDRSGEYAHFDAGGFPYREHEAMMAEQGIEPGSQRGAVRTRTDGGHHDWALSIPVPAKWTRPTEEHPDTVRAWAIADFILDAPPARPFAAWCSLGAPHPPLLVPEPWLSMFDPGDVEPPPGFDASADDLPEAVADAPGRQAVRGWGWEQWARGIAAYLGFVAFADACHGVVLDALARSGRARDTLVMMTGDHGEMLGAHGLYQKGVLYDRACRLPLMMRGPGIAPGRRTQLASHVDLAPTVLDLLGIPPLARAQGKSLAPMLRDPDAPGPEFTFIEFNGHIDGGYHVRGVVTERHKYVHYHEEPERDQLFDLAADPDELHNLASNAAHTGVRAHLQAALAEWMRDTGDFFQPCFEQAPAVPCNGGDSLGGVTRRHDIRQQAKGRPHATQ